MAPPRKEKTPPASTTLQPVPANTLRMIPFGGLGEIGMNITAIEFAGKILVIDCGQSLPDETMPGVDVVIPDIDYLVSRRADVLGIVVTHGHEDHIGALPHLAPKLGVPIYAPRMAVEILKSKFSEVKPTPTVPLHTYSHAKPLKLGPFEISFVRVTHSIPDTFALAIKTSLGVVVWSGDFKIDPNGLGDSVFDVHEFARLGSAGVLAFFCDSTNATVDGYSGHEIDLIDPLDLIFWESGEGAIFFSTFSSSLHRIQTVLDLAVEHGRSVHVGGRSITRNVEIGRRLGLLHTPDNLLVDAQRINELPPSRRLIICAGSQGEPASALSRISLGEHQKLRAVDGDTVLMSARIIPGNERAIYRMVNHFHRRGAKVFTERDAKIHVSGHACRQELKQLIALLKPRHLIPIHGELRHLRALRDIGRDMGIADQNVHLLDRGDVLHLDAKGARLAGHLGLGRVMVDGREPDALADVVIRDRQHLAEDGMLVVVLAVDAEAGEIVTGPEIATRGFVPVEKGEHILEECKRVAADTFYKLDAEARGEAKVVQEEIRRALRKHIAKTYDRHPIILPTILEM